MVTTEDQKCAAIKEFNLLTRTSVTMGLEFPLLSAGHMRDRVLTGGETWGDAGRHEDNFKQLVYRTIIR